MRFGNSRMPHEEPERIEMKIYTALISAISATCAALAAPTIDESRVYEDFKLGANTAGDAPAALKISFALDFPSPVRAVTLHLKSGDGWYSADIARFNPDLTAPVSLRIPVSAFAPEGSPGKLGDATQIRISAWMNAPAAGTITLAAATFAKAAQVAVIRATDKTAPGESWFAGKMAERAEALLAAAKIDYDVVSDDLSLESAKAFKTLLLPYSPKPPVKTTLTFAAFVKAGGKLLVFYNASPALAKAMGMTAGPWEQGQFPWSAIELAGDFGAGRRIPYYTENAIPPHPAPGSDAKVAGWLLDNVGRKTSRPAVVVSKAGAWFAHVPPRAYPAAADLVSDLVKGNVQTAGKRQKPLSNLPKGKPVAAWLNTPFPRDKGGWKATAPKLKELGINTLFVHFQAADTLLPSVTTSGTDNLSEAIAECKKNGIKLHAWVSCFSLDGVPAEKRRKFAAEKRTLPGNKDWLDPSLVQNHDLIVPALAALAKRGVDGVHLDYTRTSDDTPVTPQATKSITEFVRKASAAIRKATPGTAVSAAVFPTPLAASHRNQDWPTWVREGFVDFVSPMIYTVSPASFKEQLDACLAVADASKLMPGIGTGADESQTNAAATEAEIDAASSCRGIAFFSLDEALLELLGE